MTFNLKNKTRLQNTTVTSCIAAVLLCSSCKQTTNDQNRTDSDLIMKINAVQEQVMAQGHMTKEEERAMLSLCNIVAHDDGLANFSPDDRMILKDVDKAPVYMGCEALSVEETKECFNHNIASFIEREFDLSIIKDLNLSEPRQVEAFFIINENGSLTGMKVRDAEVSIQAELLRVLRKIPIMKPAVHKDEDVAVLCSIIVTYGQKIEVELSYIPERPNA